MQATALGELGTDLDTRLVPRFSSTAARDTAISAPVDGMACYVTSTAAGANNRALNIYNGSAWVPYYRSPVFARKTATETVTSSTVFQNDDHLFVSVEANTTYEMSLWMNYVGATDNVSDIKIQLTYPTAATMAGGALGGDVGLTASSATVNLIAVSGLVASPLGTFQFGTDDLTLNLQVTGLLVVGSTAGTLQVQWAQSASSANGVTVNPGSYLKLQRVA